MDETYIVSRMRDIVNNGVFGNSKLLSMEYDDTNVCSESVSNIYCMEVRVRRRKGEIVVHNLAIKMPDRNLKDNPEIAVMFLNELAMYQEVLPGMRIDQTMYPRIFYGYPLDAKDDSTLILENMKHKGMVPYDDDAFLNKAHVSLAMKLIAKFHSFSFIMKHDNLIKYKNIVSQGNLFRIESPHSCGLEFDYSNYKEMYEGLTHLFPLKDDTVELFTALLYSPMRLRLFLEKSTEPFSVLLHGDFNNGNILYKYDDETGEPVDCTFLDFQLSRPGSLAADLSYFLYMHTTDVFRRNYWDEMLKLYYDTLRERVPPYINLFSYRAFLDHFAPRAVYGYTLASFTLPALMTNMCKKRLIPRNLAPIAVTAALEVLKKFAITRAKNAITTHLLERGYLYAFLIHLSDNKPTYDSTKPPNFP